MPQLRALRKRRVAAGAAGAVASSAAVPAARGAPESGDTSRFTGGSNQCAMYKKKASTTTALVAVKSSDGDLDGMVCSTELVLQRS